MGLPHVYDMYYHTTLGQDYIFDRPSINNQHMYDKLILRHVRNWNQTRTFLIKLEMYNTQAFPGILYYDIDSVGNISNPAPHRHTQILDAGNNVSARGNMAPMQCRVSLFDGNNQVAIGNINNIALEFKLT